MEIEDETTEII